MSACLCYRTCARPQPAVLRCALLAARPQSIRVELQSSCSCTSIRHMLHWRPVRGGLTSRYISAGMSSESVASLGACASHSHFCHFVATCVNLMPSHVLAFISCVLCTPCTPPAPPHAHARRRGHSQSLRDRARAFGPRSSRHDALRVARANRGDHAACLPSPMRAAPPYTRFSLSSLRRPPSLCACQRQGALSSPHPASSPPPRGRRGWRSARLPRQAHWRRRQRHVQHERGA